MLDFKLICFDLLCIFSTTSLSVAVLRSCKIIIKLFKWPLLNVLTSAYEKIQRLPTCMYVCMYVASNRLEKYSQPFWPVR